MQKYLIKIDKQFIRYGISAKSGRCHAHRSILISIPVKRLGVVLTVKFYGSDILICWTIVRFVVLKIIFVSGGGGYKMLEGLVHSKFSWYNLSGLWDKYIKPIGDESMPTF